MAAQLLQVTYTAGLEASAGPQWTDITSAAAAVAAALFALVALVLAMKSLSYAKAQVQGAADQLAQARDLAEEQARPYVVIYTRTRDEVSPHLVDLVIENLGATGARDVTLAGAPPLTRSDPDGSGGDGGQAVALPPVIPFLAPGQRWQTFWDSGLARKDSGLPDRFEVTISYLDSRAQQHSELFVLDWSAFVGRMWPTEKTVHHAAVALGGVAGTLKTWVGRDEVVRVATYDGEDLNRRQAKEARSRLNKREALHRQLLSPATPSDSSSPSPMPASTPPAPSAPPSASRPHHEGEEGEQP